MVIPMATTNETRKDILDILTALEFGTRKEERELLDGVFRALGIERPPKKELVAEAILRGVGFETFLLEVLSAVRPFALMLRDLYTFLNRAEAITRRRASIFRISSANAAAKLDFSLDHFPRELISALTEGVRDTAVVELRFPGFGLESDAALDWSRVEASDAWNAISPRWDNDFYDDGFHRALSSAHTILPPTDEEAWSKLREIAEPLLDRLAAIVSCVNSIQPLGIREAYFSAEREPAPFQPSLPEPRFHRILCDEARPILLRATQTSFPSWSSDNKTQKTVLDELHWHLYSMIVAIHMFRHGRLRRGRPDDWLQRQLRFPSEEAYLSLIADLAGSYRQKLDRVAPVVENLREVVLEERLVEFLLLPFWKHRWFLYELWTLVFALDAAGRHWRLELAGLEETTPGVIEWKLPGGTATRPVAMIGDGEQQALCWTQRKTYHPGTGEGLEPDLRFTSLSPSYHDLIIIENKDRRKPPGPEMEEIARRYVEGTCTRGLWLVNYDTFTGSLKRLESTWPERRVHVISRFRPGEVPEEFHQELQTILAEHLGQPEAASQEPAEQSFDEITVTLTWGAEPRDLDLYVWVARDDGIWQISFRDRGRLDVSPYAELDTDVRGGNGRETVRVLTAGLRSLKIAVHNYSNESSLAGSDARLVVSFGEWRRSEFSVHHPGDDQRWWAVAEYDHAAAQLTMLDVLTQTEPVLLPKSRRPT